MYGRCYHDDVALLATDFDRNKGGRKYGWRQSSHHFLGPKKLLRPLSERFWSLKGY